MSLRKIKSARSRLLAPLGIVMLLLLIVASSASADGRFRAGSYVATVQGEATSAPTWSIGTITVTCNQMTLNGTLASASRTLNLQPSYAMCSSNSGFTAAVSMNGCEYAWEIESLGSGTAGGAQTIKCAPGQKIEITRSFGGEVRCRYAIAPQGPSKSISYENKGSGASSKVHAEPAINLIAEVLYGGSAICAGSAGSTKAISYSGGVDLSALKGGAPTGLSVGGAGLYLTGEASENPANQPKFASETGTEPLTVKGSVTAGKSHVITFQGIRTAQCSEVGLTGQLLGPATSLRLVPSYPTYCTGNGGTTVAFDTNSCYYDLSLLNAGPPYAGNLALGCNETGDGIEALVWATGIPPEAGKELCIFKLGPQTGLGSVGLETTGSGFDRKIAVDLNLTGIQYTRLKGTLGNCGPASSSKGTYSGGSTLIGL